LTAYDFARLGQYDACANHLQQTYGAQRADLVANLLARRLQRFYRRCFIRRNTTQEIDHASMALAPLQQLSLSQEKLDKRHRARSLQMQPMVTENDLQERRRMFAKSRTTVRPIDQSDDSK
jgi:hypothetical protein